MLSLPRKSRAAALLGLWLLSSASLADDQGPAGVHVGAGTRMVLSTGTTVTGEPIQYPTNAPAKITAVEITLVPGQQTGWHTHPVPLFGYILQGELTVDYGPKGKRVYRQGEGLAEAMNEPHDGRNTGTGALRILAVFVGADGVPNTVAAPVPSR
jgi:quercetin dioxygenase-like cupin family protein